MWRQAPGVGVREGSTRGAGDSEAPGPAHGRCEAGPGARATPGSVVLKLKPTRPREPSACRAPEGRAARASVYPKRLRGFSTRLAHCSGGPRQRSSSAPPLQPSPSTWPLSRLYASTCRAASCACRFRLRFGPFLVPKNRLRSRKCRRRPLLRGRRLESGGLLYLGAAAIEPAASSAGLL